MRHTWVDDIRVRTKFAFLPKKVYSRWVWLKPYVSVEELRVSVWSDWDDGPIRTERWVRINQT